MNENKPMLTAGQLQKALNVSRTTYERWIKLGIPCVTLPGGGNRRYDLEQVKAWMKEKEQK